MSVKELSEILQSKDVCKIKQALINCKEPLSCEQQLLLLDTGSTELLAVYNFPLSAETIDYLIAAYQKAEEADNEDEQCKLLNMFEATLRYTPLNPKQCREVALHPHLALVCILWLQKQVQNDD